MTPSSPPHTLPQNNLKKTGSKLRYKAVFIHLFIYVYLLQKRTGDRKQAGLGPLPSAHSSQSWYDKYESAQGRVAGGSYVGGRGCAMHMQASLGAVTWAGVLVHREALYTA